jgi:LacI family transcriptional regulator
MLAHVQSVPARRRRPTMRDVAQLADVSLKTVSRVVNDEHGVSAMLAARVQRAIDELGFRPHPSARLLRRTDDRTAAIALLLEDVANPFSAAVQRAVENEARAHGVVVFSASIDEDPARERSLAREFGARRVDGLLLAPAGDDQSYLVDELPEGTPVVCVDREASNLAVDSVITTNALGAAEGVRHLAAAGHRRIAFLGDRRSIRTAEQRYAGYRDALVSLGLPLDPGLVLHDLRESADADGAVTALLARPAHRPVHRAEPDHDRGGAGPAQARRGVVRRARRVRRRPARGSALAGHHRGGAESGRDRADRGEPAVRPHRRRCEPTRSAAGADDPHPPRIGRAPAPLIATCSDHGPATRIRYGARDVISVCGAKAAAVRLQHRMRRSCRQARAGVAVGVKV